MSLLRELRWRMRFRARRRAPAQFQRLALDESRRWSADPRFEPFVDGVFWAARPGPGRFAGELWLLGDRMFNGWPDPPEWGYWALDDRGAVRCAWDFDEWPPAWGRPPETKAAPSAVEET